MAARIEIGTAIVGSALRLGSAAAKALEAFYRQILDGKA